MIWYDMMGYGVDVMRRDRVSVKCDVSVYTWQYLVLVVVDELEDCGWISVGVPSWKLLHRHITQDNEIYNYHCNMLTCRCDT